MKSAGKLVSLPALMQYHNDTELSSLEETRCQFNGGKCVIKLGIDVHQEFYVVVEQRGWE